MKKRLIISIITGSLLGILCIIGLSYRMGFEGNEMLIAATWFNRFIMGVVIGLAGKLKITKSNLNHLFRGALLGLLISFSLYIATGFIDTPGFIAGIIYGIIIDLIATKYAK